jgi:hypothetical protein
MDSYLVALAWVLDVKREVQVSWRMMRSAISNMELFAVRTPASKGRCFFKSSLLVGLKRKERAFHTSCHDGGTFLLRLHQSVGSDGSLFEATPSTLFMSYVSWFTGFLYFVLYFTPLILTLIT